MEWMTVKEAPERWGVSGRRVQILCDNGKIPSIKRLGKPRVIPKNTLRLMDGHTRAVKEVKTGKE